MRSRLLSVVWAFLLLQFSCQMVETPQPALCAVAFPGAAWEERTPEAMGMDAAKVDQFVANVGGAGVLVKNGYLVKTWGGYTNRSDWASAAKPVVSTLLFIAIEEGLIDSVDENIRPLVQSHFGEDLIAKDQGMTWRHLANMTSGYSRGEAPGEAWAYNDTAIQLYSTLLFDAVFGDTTNNIAMDRFSALQFEDGGLFGSRGGRGINASPRDFARIGWLWLNRGNWNGSQILPRSYFDAYMKEDVPVELPRTTAAGSDYLGVGSFGGDSDQTGDGPGIYGFNWWFNAETPGGSLAWPDAPPDTFMASGHWSEEIVVIIPSLNIVASARGRWGSWDPGNPSAGMNQNLALLAQTADPGVGLDGQIIVDPAHPRWLKRKGGGSVFICGPGDPEDFLYRGTRNPDGTRDGDQADLISKLADNGGNSIYMQIVRSHGGDGQADHNPFVDSDPANGLDQDILDQWEQWFTQMDQEGILSTLFFYDDSAGIWNTGDVVGPEEQAFIEQIVDRFEHHKNLIWVVAEEYSERYSPARVSSIAAVIRAADDNDHVTGVHQLSGLTFDFPDDPDIEQFAMQYNGDTAQDLHAGMVTAWGTADGRYNLNMSEAANYGSGDVMRRKNWAVAMGGAYVMVLGMMIDTTSVSDLNACRIQQTFFESTDFATMAPRDDLGHDGTEYVLANPGVSTIAYASANGSEIGLRSMNQGSYDFTWLDCVSGDSVTQEAVGVAAGDQSWPTPAGIGDELAVWIRVAGPGGPTPGPVAVLSVDARIKCEGPGETVFSVDGSGSTGAARYEWTATGFDSPPAFDDPSAAVTAMRVPSTGTRQTGEVRLTVYDAPGTGSDSATEGLTIWRTGETSVGSSLLVTREGAGARLRWAGNGRPEYRIYEASAKESLAVSPTGMTLLGATPDMLYDTAAGAARRFFQVFGACP